MKDLKLYSIIAGVIVFVVAIILSITLPLSAFESLEPTEVGLAYSAV